MNTVPLEHTIVEQHMPLAYSCARRYYDRGADRDDIEQEALVALLTAFRLYDPGRGTFRSWARLVIHRRLIEIVRASTRQPAAILTDAARTCRSEDGEPVDVLDLLPARDGDPVTVLETKEELARIIRAARSLTALERRALAGVVNGIRYDQLGDPKSIDNAVTSARRKLRSAA